MFGFQIGAVLDGAEVVGGRQNPLGEQESRGQLSIGSRCAHDDGKGPAVKSNLERLFGGGAVRAQRANALADASDIDGAECVSH